MFKNESTEKVSKKDDDDEPTESVFMMLLSIENRLTSIESSMKWFRGVSRLAAVVIFGALGLDAGGLV